MGIDRRLKQVNDIAYHIADRASSEKFLFVRLICVPIIKKGGCVP